MHSTAGIGSAQARERAFAARKRAAYLRARSHAERTASCTASCTACPHWGLLYSCTAAQLTVVYVLFFFMYSFRFHSLYFQMLPRFSFCIFSSVVFLFIALFLCFRMFSCVLFCSGSSSCGDVFFSSSFHMLFS